jgi:predicted O-methyltransferase YrrM
MRRTRAELRSFALAKRLARRPARWALRILSRLLGPVFAVVARTGAGSDECVRHGFVPVPLHFYQPVFDPDAIDERIWERRHPMPGIDFAPDRQLDYLSRLAAFAGECDWPARGGAAGGYHYLNGAFGYSSACLLHSMIRLNRPAKVVEVGAGMSTLVMDGALAANQVAGAARADLVTVDPYPSPALDALSEDRLRLIAAPAEKVPLEEFASLRANDLLFIDSSHVVRTGGDVTFLYLDVLPRLATGVIVHVHDIQLPYDYPRVYADGKESARYFWTEQYLLQAFLACNPHFEILIAGHFLQHDHADAFARSFPGLRPGSHRVTSSFYMRRVDAA